MHILLKILCKCYFNADFLLFRISQTLLCKTSAWLRSLAWIKRSICNEQLNWGFSIVHVFKAYPLFNNATWKNMAKLYVGNVREHFALLPSTLARVIGTFWPGTKLRTATGREPARCMVPNTQWGQKTEARSYPEKRKKKKESRKYWPKCFISHSQCLTYHHTILLFLSTLKSILNMSQLVLLSSFPTLPQKVWNKNEEDTCLMSHTQEPTQIFFCLSAPPHGHVASLLLCSSPKTTYTTEQIIFCKVATPPGGGLWNPPCM